MGVWESGGTMDADFEPEAQAQPGCEESVSEQMEIIERYPLSHGQYALWFVQQLHPDSVAHNIVYAVRVRSAVDYSAVKRVLCKIANRHSLLRTTFSTVDGQPVACVHAQADVPVEQVNADGWSKEKLDEILKRQMFLPFDLEHGPLMRLTGYTFAPEDHIWLVSLHHIVIDMWSMAIVLSELEQFYAEEVAGSPTSLKPVSTTYKDFVLQQNEMLAGMEGERLWTFWKNKLSGDLPVLNLPTDYPRPPIQTDRGDSIFLHFKDALTGRIKAQAEALGTTCHTLVLAAFQVLLHRLCDQDDILVGYPKFGRSRQTANVIGYFINPVVLRADFKGDPTFREFLGKVKNIFQEVSEHDAFPFRITVERLQPERDLSRSPIFQVMFAWQKTTRVAGSDRVSAIALGEEGQNKELHLGKLILEPYNIQARVTPFDLTLLMAESEGELAATFEYNVALFEKETVQRILGNFITLLEGIVANPDLPLSGYSLLTSEEVELLTLWNDTDTGEDLPDCLPYLFEHQTKQIPENPAVILDGACLSYKQLNQEANRLAHGLIKQGVLPGMVIGLCIERSIDMVVALLGIMKSGGVYLPLDPDYPPERLAFMIENSGCAMVLTLKALMSRLPGDRQKVFCLDDPKCMIYSKKKENPRRIVEHNHPAYILYTSGSTGKPKGVLVEHGALAGHCRNVQQFYQITPQDRVLHFAPLNFDPSIEQTFTAFLGGATLVLRGEELWEPAGFMEKLRKTGVSVINLTPAYWHQVVKTWAECPEAIPCGQLRLAIIGGDVIQPEILRLWRQTPMRKMRLLNAYGPTEAIVTAITCELTEYGERAIEMNRVPIGKPLPNRKAYILDSHGHPTPPGVPGELYLGGPYLARSYVNDPEQTNAVFQMDPFSRQRGARMYRTGDLARYRPDGIIEFCGRNDSQIKIRSFRVELGEIESVLIRHPAIREVVVTTEELAGGERRMIAYYVCRENDRLDHQDLRAHVTNLLPAHMIPSVFIPLEKIPLTASGKVDRKSLPPPDEKLENTAEFIAPRDPIEEDLAKLWAEVLKTPRVGIYDNFFDLGGHSLTATRLVARVRSSYHVELPLRRLFETPNIAGMAAALVQEMLEQAEKSEVEELLAEVDNLSDEEIHQWLSGTSNEPAV